MILYLECQDLETRQSLSNYLEKHGFNWIDCTGGQLACEDGDFERFRNLAVQWTNKQGKTLYRVIRMEDPGLGLCFSEEWLKKGIDTGEFQIYKHELC